MNDEQSKIAAAEGERIESQESGQEPVSEPAKKRPKKKAAIVGAVAAVIVAAGVGFWVWHETPGFCGAICHTSMDAYLETYEQDAGTTGVDKYGNEVEDTSAMLVVSHKDDDVACLQCHEPVLTQQVSELIESVTGDYSVVARNNGNGYALLETSAKDLLRNAGKSTETGDEFCLKSGCHDVTRDDLAEKTADMSYNPHACPHDDFACSNCHKSHRASVYYCTNCHSEAEGDTPEGWLTYSESQEMLP